MVGYCSSKILDFGIGISYFDRIAKILQSYAQSQIGMVLRWRSHFPNLSKANFRIDRRQYDEMLALVGEVTTDGAIAFALLIGKTLQG